MIILIHQGFVGIAICMTGLIVGIPIAWVLSKIIMKKDKINYE